MPFKTIYNWLYKLYFKYKNTKKNIFINIYKYLNMFKDYLKFLNKIKNLNPILIIF